MMDEIMLTFTQAAAYMNREHFRAKHNQMVGGLSDERTLVENGTGMIFYGLIPADSAQEAVVVQVRTGNSRFNPRVFVKVNIKLSFILMSGFICCRTSRLCL